MSTKRIASAIMLSVSLATGALAQPQQGTLVDKIIARVDDQIILQSELDNELELYKAQQGPQVPDLKCQILAGMLVNKMLLARAQVEGVTVEKAAIEDRFSRKMQEFLHQAGSEAIIEQYTGKPIRAFKEELRKLIKEQLVINQMHKKIVDDLSITPAEVQAFFDKLPTDSLPYYPAEVEVRQIVRYPSLSQQDKAAIIERLQAFKARIQVGEQFEQLAKQYSEDPGSASSGGELGFWRLGELALAYEAAALALKPGEISDPVETQAGFHLIQLIERQKDRYNTRHILIKPSASAPDLQEAIAHLDSIRTSILEKHTTFEKAAQEYSEDVATAQQGGLLTGGDGGVSMPIDALPPEVFFTIDKLVPGAISEPVTLTTAIGKQAVRILYLKEKVPPHQANLQQDYEKIYQMALEAKRSTVLQEWVQSIKASVSIDIAPEYQHCMLLQ